MYYYSTIGLILIYRPSEGGRLSQPRHCCKCAARAQSCASQWFSWKHKLLSAARFEPGPSRAAGKRATTRLLRPAMRQRYVTFNNHMTLSGPLAVDASFQFVDIRELGTIKLLLNHTAQWSQQIVNDFVVSLNILSRCLHYSLFIHCQPKYDLCISQGSVATVLRWDSQNHSHLCHVSSWCKIVVKLMFCIPKIIKIGQSFSRGAPDLDPDSDPARYPVFYLDPVGSGSGRIQKYQDPAKSGSGRIQKVWIRSTGFITM